MCCSNSQPIFKGVVISTSILVLINLVGCEKTPLIPFGSTQEESCMSNDSFNCKYLEKSLDCSCNTEQHGIASQNTQPLVFPPENCVSNSVTSIKLHSCQNIDLQVDLRPLKRSFNKLSFEDVQEVKVDGITTLPGDLVEIWFQNINSTVDLTGGLHCQGCQENEGANLKLHFLDVGEISLTEVYTTDFVKAEVKVRNADSLKVEDSYFSDLEKNSFQIFNVPYVFIHHTEFHRVYNGSIVLNNVANATFKDSLLEKSAVEVLNAVESILNWKCTVSPLVMPSEVFSPEELASCSTYGRRSIEIGNSGSLGAIMLAAVSFGLLLIILAILILMQKTGRLEQYI